MQEGNTAKNAILSALPTARVEMNRVDAYPIYVKIVNLSSGEPQVLFHKRQQDLFGKNRSKREQSIEEIKQAVAQLA
jgi:hypothetical protein